MRPRKPAPDPMGRRSRGPSNITIRRLFTEELEPVPAAVDPDGPVDGGAERPDARPSSRGSRAAGGPQIARLGGADVAPPGTRFG